MNEAGGLALKSFKYYPRHGGYDCFHIIPFPNVNKLMTLNT